MAATRSATRDALSAIPKAGVEMLVRAIAVEEGVSGVRCNAASTGLLEGEGMWESLLAHGDVDEASLAVVRRSIPMGCFGTPR